MLSSIGEETRSATSKQPSAKAKKHRVIEQSRVEWGRTVQQHTIYLISTGICRQYLVLGFYEVDLYIHVISFDEHEVLRPCKQMHRTVVKNTGKM